MTIEESTIYQAAIASQKERVLLVLDEWDKSRPSADGYFLDFFQSGRLPLPPQNGKKIQANLDNLLIMLTSNDERPFSEPFLRRFSKIDIEQLHPKLVKNALMSTHSDHKHLPNVLVLYCRSLASKMSKPVTIQELRQLLDAIDYLGKYADWDTLVRQFITKTEENHLMLKDAENLDLEDFESYIEVTKTKIDTSAYGNVPEKLDTPSDEEEKSYLPSLVEMVDWDESSNDGFELSEVSSDGGIVEDCDEMYSILAYLGEATDNPYNLTWIKKCTDSLAIQQPINIESLLQRHDGRGSKLGAFGHVYPMVGLSIGRRARTITKKIEELKGEVMFTLRNCERAEFLRLSKYNRHLVKTMTKNEVITRRVFHTDLGNNVKRKIEINWRWSAEMGLQIICPVSYLHNLSLEFKTGRSMNASLLWNGIESDGLDTCPSNYTFGYKYKMPNSNVRVLRLYHQVAEFGVTRFPLNDAPNVDEGWVTLSEAISKEKGYHMYHTDDIDVGEFQYYPTDWVKCDSLTAGVYSTQESAHWLEIRIHGHLSKNLLNTLTSLVNIVPAYMFVENTSGRSILKELTNGRGGWVPYPLINATVQNSKGIRFSTFGNQGVFWVELTAQNENGWKYAQLKQLWEKYSR
tara:strand:- start:5 stop:1900 length:1896 start_codon:yes stop_codon:yes gene_type:complete